MPAAAAMCRIVDVPANAGTIATVDAIPTVAKTTVTHTSVESRSSRKNGSNSAITNIVEVTRNSGVDGECVRRVDTRPEQITSAVKCHLRHFIA